MKTTFLRKTSMAGQLFIVSTLFIALSCDTVEVDPDLRSDVTKANPGTVFMMSGSSAIIDLSAKISTSQDVTVQVTAATTKGSLTNLGGGLLQYMPQAGVARSTDNFEYTVTGQSNEVLDKDTVTIVIEENPEELPTGIYPVADIVYGATNSVSVSLDVLENDFLSTYTSSEITVSIYAPDAAFPPYFGSAVVNGSTVTYTPAADFSGADKIVYKAALRSDPTVFALGSVLISSALPCDFTVADDRYVAAEPFTEIRIPVLDNDQLCQANNVFDIKILREPSIGSVLIESGVMVYRLADQAENGFSDSFQYEVTIDGNSKAASVDVSVDTSLAGDCDLTAVDDFIDLTNSTSTKVELDVLANDKICGSEVELTLEVGPVHGQANVYTDASGKQFIEYLPDFSLGADDKFFYTISAGGVQRTGAVSIKRIQ